MTNIVDKCHRELMARKQAGEFMTTPSKQAKSCTVVDGDGTPYRLIDIYMLIKRKELADGQQVRRCMGNARYIVLTVMNGRLVEEGQPAPAIELTDQLLRACFEWMKQHDPVTPQQLYEYAYGPGFDAGKVERLLDRLERHGYPVTENNNGKLYAAEPVHSYRARGVLLARTGN